MVLNDTQVPYVWSVFCLVSCVLPLGFPYQFLPLLLLGLSVRVEKSEWEVWVEYLFFSMRRLPWWQLALQFRIRWLWCLTFCYTVPKLKNKQKIILYGTGLYYTSYTLWSSQNVRNILFIFPGTKIELKIYTKTTFCHAYSLRVRVQTALTFTFSLIPIQTDKKKKNSCVCVCGSAH